MHSTKENGWFVNSPKMNQYCLLKNLAEDPHLIQAEIGKLVGVSVAMVNNYMKELVEDGLIEYHRKSTKRISYHPTEKGKETLDALNGDLFTDLVNRFDQSKQLVWDMIGARVANFYRVMILGEEAPSELVALALKEKGIEIVWRGKDWKRSGLSADDWIRVVMNVINREHPEAAVLIGLEIGNATLIEWLMKRGIHLVPLNTKIPVEESVLA